MRYTNATQILPPELLAQIQEYADGIFLYIPRKEANKRPWGSLTSTRQELVMRNRNIFHQHQTGITVAALAEQYFLSQKTIHRIIKNQREYAQKEQRMYIETERLIITEFDETMAEAVHLNSLDADNRRFVPDEVFETVEEAAETIAFLMGCYKTGNGPLVYPLLLKTGENIGYVQAVPMDDGVWEIGYHIAAAFTKQGYATEAVQAFLPVIMETLKLPSMLGVCLADNAASVKVMTRCGFEKTFEGIGNYQGESREICKFLYRLP